MIFLQKSGRYASISKKGFTLVITLALMVLLASLAVGLLSLSAVSLRGVSHVAAQAEARANAHLALMIAIGELQKQMGPDQRISAKASILDADPQTPQIDEVNHPHWTGVWDSWVAGAAVPLSTTTTPDPASEHSTIPSLAAGMAPTYVANRSDHFREWLVSLLPEDADKALSAKDLVMDGKEFPGKDDIAIRLVGSGSGNSSTDYVSARLIDADSPNGGKGRYGWWVGDESQKARVLHDSYVSKPPANSAEKIYRGQSPGSTGTKNIKDLEGITAAQDLKLDGLPSMKTLDLVPGDTSKQPARKNFHDVTSYSSQVLADVREGGLKRDLSTILEQPILRTNTGPEYMLYEFDDPRFPDRSHSRVPIQDLAAYYQLYDNEPTFSNSRREGVRYTSTGLPNAIQLRTPDYDGGTKDRKKILREYTTLYKQPVITKVQFLLAVGAEPITTTDREWVKTQTYLRSKQPMPPIRDSDTHKLKLGMTTMVTFWNPNNLPLVMDAHQILRFSTPPFGLRWRKYRSGGGFYDYRWSNLSYAAANSAGGAATGQNSGFCLLRLSFAKNAAQRVVFEPGEVKVFSLPSTAGGTLTKGGNAVPLVSEGTNMDTFTGWYPFGFFLMPNSTPQGPYADEAPEAYDFDYCGGKNSECMVFSPNDSISLSIDTDDPVAAMAGDWRDGRFIAGTNEIKGAGFNLYMLDEGYQRDWRDAIDFLRHYTMISRHGGTSDRPSAGRVSTFYKELMTPGFPGGVAPINFTSSTDAIPVSQIIGASAAGEVISIMEFSLSIGCETGAGASGGFGGGRRITSRPFLHSASSAGPFIDQNNDQSLYNYGWDWQLGRVNSVEDSIVTAKPGTGNGYYGGGYTIENGTTHVVQREIPVLPVISIASLSHAHLGGFSLGYSNVAGDDPENDKLWFKSARMSLPVGVDYQKTSATGQGGLAPHIVQATGNSYAHPNIPADKAFTTWTRLFDEDTGEGTKVVPFVDHSYLANKALWDEFYFSSIAPQPAKIPLFGGADRTAKQVADDFFKLGSAVSSSPLPNRRIKPYTTNLNQSKLDELFSPAQNIYTNGLADKIAAYLMVEGAFNVNSTSVDAWKVFLSSLKGKPVAYLDGGNSPKESIPQGTPISPGSLPNGAPVKSADISGSNQPTSQWKSGRELTDDEIEQLANAMVKQVKLRGPFLSMSEFVNRRLEGDNNPDASARSAKGALQAALDDPTVAINASFRTPGRLIDSETAGTSFAFPDAAKGPVAYGSNAYVDQADVLRGFAEQLTPRGDTFIIRTYGDSLDASGKVVARAWCEAVVQRVPEYVNSADEPHLKQADPALSAQSKRFGRKIQIVSFRWINPLEV